MSLEQRIIQFGKDARERLLASRTNLQNKAKQGKATWIGYDQNGNGLVKQDGIEKTVTVIGNISLTKGSIVYIDSQNTIEVRSNTTPDSKKGTDVSTKLGTGTGTGKKNDQVKTNQSKINPVRPYIVSSRPLIIRGERDSVICIAVIDENDGDPTVTSRWLSFREIYPDRPFYLLRPVPAGASGGLSIPSSLWGPENNAFFYEVCRETCVSNWYTLAELNGGNAGANVILFIDTSGSMSISTVQPSINLFKQYCDAAGLKVKAVYNSNEDYITPFYVDDDFFDNYETVWPF